MRIIIVSSVLLLFSFTSNVFAKNFLPLCESPKKLDSVIEHHTKVYFPEYVNDKLAFSNLKAKTKKYVKLLCSNVGKRAYHEKWLSPLISVRLQALLISKKAKTSVILEGMQKQMIFIT